MRVVEDRGEDVGSVTTSDALEVARTARSICKPPSATTYRRTSSPGTRICSSRAPSGLTYLDVIGRHLRDRPPNRWDVERARVRLPARAEGVSVTLVMQGYAIAAALPMHARLSVRRTDAPPF